LEELLQPERGRVIAGRHHLPLRVYYEDTDAGGVVYHANYLRFLERGRTEMMALLGVGEIAALAREGWVYVVTGATLAFRQPARLGDVLTIVSEVTRVRGARCLVQQWVMRNGQVLASADMQLALIGSDGRPRPHPKAWLAALTIAKGPETAT
jgi:acyl-CoA thioester hydrolase